MQQLNRESQQTAEKHRKQLQESQTPSARLKLQQSVSGTYLNRDENRHGQMSQQKTAFVSTGLRDEETREREGRQQKQREKHRELC